MTLGSITSLGVGSGFELQDILDKLRQADEITVNLKEAEKTKLEAQVTEFDSINAKLIQMRSSALSLSLESNFLERTATLSDEDIASATAIVGTELASYNIGVTRLATKSSFQSAGQEEENSPLYSAPVTTFTTPLQPAVTEKTAFSFTIGQGEDQKSVSVEIAADSNLNEIADLINSAAENLDENGSPYAKATVESGADGHYIRLSAADDSSLNNNRIFISGEQDPDEPGLDFIARDLVFDYQVGTGGTDTSKPPVYVVVPPGTSFQDLVSIINEDSNNTGVTAAMINDGSADTPYRLTLTAKDSGEDNRISLNSTHTGMPDTPVDVLTMTEMQGAEESLNASFSVDGVEYQRQSNAGLESVIQGVTLNLDKIGETQLTISADSDNMKEKITQFIDTYNELVQEISSKIRYDSDEEKNGILSNVSSVKRLNSELAALLTTTVDTNNDISSLMDLGVELNQDGTITLDSKALDAAFSTSHNDVTKLFIGDSDNGLKGLGDILNDYLTEMTGSTGLVNGEKSAAEGKISRLESSIAVNVERLDKRYELLALQFVQLDAFIGSMNTQSQYLTSVFDAFNNSQQS